MALSCSLGSGKYLRRTYFIRARINNFSKSSSRKYNGDFNPLLGLLYMKVGKIQLFKQQCKEALHNLNKASDILRVTHGDDHKLYRTELVPMLIQAAVELPDD